MKELKAKQRLQEDKQEFIDMLGMLRGDAIYEAGLTIAVHSKVYNMIYNGEINQEGLYELILNYESPIVNIITGDYIITNHTDFNDLKYFVNRKIKLLIEENVKFINNTK